MCFNKFYINLNKFQGEESEIQFTVNILISIVELSIKSLNHSLTTIDQQLDFSLFDIIASANDATAMVTVALSILGCCG